MNGARGTYLAPPKPLYCVVSQGCTFGHGLSRTAAVREAKGLALDLHETVVEVWEQGRMTMVDAYQARLPLVGTGKARVYRVAL